MMLKWVFETSKRLKWAALICASIGLLTHGINIFLVEQPMYQLELVSLFFVLGFLVFSINCVLVGEAEKYGMNVYPPKLPDINNSLETYGKGSTGE
jgi:hypothetical protein